MKKTLLIALLALGAITFSSNANAQTAPADTAKIKPKEQYCMIVATAKMFSSKVNITVDFGQETSLFSFKDQRLKDDAGKVLSFNSVIDALNYMSGLGWEFVNAYALTSGNGNVLNYVMKKKN